MTKTRLSVKPGVDSCRAQNSQQAAGLNGTEIARQAADNPGYGFHGTESIDQAPREMGLLKSVAQILENFRC